MTLHNSQHDNTLSSKGAVAYTSEQGQENVQGSNLAQDNIASQAHSESLAQKTTYSSEDATCKETILAEDFVQKDTILTEAQDSLHAQEVAPCLSTAQEQAVVPNNCSLQAQNDLSKANLAQDLEQNINTANSAKRLICGYSAINSDKGEIFEACRNCVFRIRQDASENIIIQPNTQPEFGDYPYIHDADADLFAEEKEPQSATEQNAGDEIKENVACNSFLVNATKDNSRGGNMPSFFLFDYAEDRFLLDIGSCRLLGVTYTGDWIPSRYLSQQLSIIETELYFNVLFTRDHGDHLLQTVRVKQGENTNEMFYISGSVIKRDETGIALIVAGYLSRIHVNVADCLARLKNNSSAFDLEVNSGEIHYGPAYKSMLGYDTDEELPQNIKEFDRRLIHPDDINVFRRVNEIIDNPQEGYYYESIFRIQHKAGFYLWCINRGLVVERNSEGRATRIIGTTTNIDVLRSNFERLRRSIYQDPLTGLHNRLYLNTRFKYFAMEESQPLSLVYVDISGLKLINDYLGHAKGDTLVKIAAQILQNDIALDHEVVRLSGDEFLLIFTECSEVQCKLCINKFNVALNERNRFQEFPLPIFFGFGIATLYEIGEDDTFLRCEARADARLQEYKNAHHDYIYAALRAFLENTLGQKIDLTDNRRLNFLEQDNATNQELPLVQDNAVTQEASSLQDNASNQTIPSAQHGAQAHKLQGASKHTISQDAQTELALEQSSLVMMQPTYVLNKDSQELLDKGDCWLVEEQKSVNLLNKLIAPQQVMPLQDGQLLMNYHAEKETVSNNLATLRDSFAKDRNVPENYAMQQDASLEQKEHNLVYANAAQAKSSLTILESNVVQTTSDFALSSLDLSNAEQVKTNDANLDNTKDYKESLSSLTNAQQTSLDEIAGIAKSQEPINHFEEILQALNQGKALTAEQDIPVEPSDFAHTKQVDWASSWVELIGHDTAAPQVLDVAADKINPELIAAAEKAVFLEDEYTRNLMDNIPEDLQADSSITPTSVLSSPIYVSGNTNVAKYDEPLVSQEDTNNINISTQTYSLERDSALVMINSRQTEEELRQKYSDVLENDITEQVKNIQASYLALDKVLKNTEVWDGEETFGVSGSDNADFAQILVLSQYGTDVSALNVVLESNKSNILVREQVQVANTEEQKVYQKLSEDIFNTKLTEVTVASESNTQAQDDLMQNQQELKEQNTLAQQEDKVEQEVNKQANSAELIADDAINGAEHVASVGHASETANSVEHALNHDQTDSVEQVEQELSESAHEAESLKVEQAQLVLGYWFYLGEEHSFLLDKQCAAYYGIPYTNESVDENKILSLVCGYSYSRFSKIMHSLNMGSVIFENVYLNNPQWKDVPFVVHGSVLSRFPDGSVRYAAGYLTQLESSFSDLITFELAGDGFFTWDQESNSLHFSSTTAQFRNRGNNDYHCSLYEWLEKMIFPEDYEILEIERNIFISSYYGDNFEFCVRLRRRKGNYVWSIVRGIVLKRNEQGVAISIIGTLSNINLVQYNFENIKQLLYTDTLTGLHNRSYFQHHVALWQDESVQPISVIYADITGLKITNDVLGHADGDALILSVTDALINVLDERCDIMRLSGDEFLVIMPNCTKEQSKERVDELLDYLHERNKQPGVMPIFIGFGRATMGEVENDTLHACIERADVRMQNFKEAHRTDNYRRLQSYLEMRKGRPVSMRDGRRLDYLSPEERSKMAKAKTNAKNTQSNNSIKAPY